jgi:hypothetical protein
MEIPSNVVTVLGTLAGAVLGGNLAARRTYSEKVWDLRRAAYGLIVSEIARIERINDFRDAMMSENSHAYFDSEVRKDHDEVGKHWAKATQRFADDYLVLSDEFIALFEKMESDADEEEPNEIWPEEMERFFNTIKTARPLLMAQARREVIKRPTWRSVFWPFR